ncbi:MULTISPECIES: catalase [Ramlibacter]|uniref:Catalase n=1 Tax=Ramlibacter pinisoli TaxID=2682844 RepID=A0A6N8IXH0_9BURK|nr:MULTISPECIES: catalase [Ramlibacter]MBA2965690.1 catalase [Ramlibacter sp. CGMCC 1.13660]MVQ30656.1 catalase [Ramlibacter pinisoli]
MAQSKPDAQRKTKAGDAGSAKQKQLEAYTQNPETVLTTSQGVVIPDNHNSLRAGLRGPTLLQDFLLLDKLSRFGHERIPERVVHARGCGAHGYFEVTKPLGQFTSADFLQEAGARTPVFVRFSTIAGERGSADTVRDLRGFAVKFYTREGNYDLVGASAPVFFIQDAMKFPDLMHALKPEPHHGMPQASSAHDTFWDFVSLMPESTHALMWLMSDRALPRSLRMMEGFGIHAYRFVNAHGVVHYVKFHWRPRLGRHALDAGEARRIAGLDPDFHRRDLWDAIAKGHHPEWELGVQLVEAGKAQALGIDLLDPTKLVPEELVPVQPVGRLVLNRNPDNYFAETEQVAFHPGHVVPGIDVSADPLLQGRLFAYTDSQLARLGGPNFHELPINRPLAVFHNHQRDGAGRQSVPRGQVSYEPNTLGNGTEFRVDGGHQGFQGIEDPLEASTVRRRSPAFDDHFSQATLFWNSQGAAEKDHIVAAFQHELARVETPAIRQRVVDNLAHVDVRLARKVAEVLALGAPDPKAAAGRAGFREQRGKLALEASPSLSIEATVAGPVATRRVAVLVAPGVEIGALKIVQQVLAEHGVGTRIVAAHLGVVATSSGQQLPVDCCFASTASVLFDAVLVPGGASHVQALAQNGDAVHFVLEAFRHCKPICVIGDGVELLKLAGVNADDAPPAGVLVSRADPAARVPLAQDFVAAIGRHRHWARQQVAVPA